MESTDTKPPRGPGRPPLSESGPQVQVNCRVSPDCAAWIAQWWGDGSASAGAKELLEQCFRDHLYSVKRLRKQLKKLGLDEQGDQLPHVV